MGLFRRLGREVEEFKRAAMAEAEAHEEFRCRDCGETFLAKEGACPECGSADVERTEGDDGGEE